MVKIPNKEVILKEENKRGKEINTDRIKQV